MANPKSAARLLSLCVAFLLLATTISSPAAAQDEERVAVVELEVLRSPVGAATVPVRVTVESLRAVEAELEVQAPSTNMSWRFPLALAANTEVQQIVVVPTDQGSLGRIEATLYSGNDSLATVRVEERAGNENAIGLLGIEAPGDQVTLNPDIGMASVIELDDLRLLPALDSLVVTPASIRSLATEEQNVLLSWVWSGKQLLVAAESGSVDDWLLEPVADGRAEELVGAGIVRYVGRDWDEHVFPGVSSATSSSFQLDGAGGGPNSELFNDGGFSIPSLRFMTIVLLVYLLIAGPVTFGILTNRNRQSLVWVVLPALAVLFTAGVFVAGKMLNSGRTDAYAAIVEVHPAGATRTETLLISRSGRRTVDLPENYSVVGTGASSGNQFDFNGGGAGSPITQRPSRTTTELEFRIDAGSGGTVVVSGADPTVANQLSLVGLTVADETLSGSIQNASAETLEESAVVIANRMVKVGAIAPGESKDFELNLGGGAGRFGNELRQWDVDPRDRFNFDGRQVDNDSIENGPVNGTSWLEWRTSKFGSAAPDGLVTAVGWSREFDSLRDGTGRTALVAHATMPDVDSPLLPSQLRTFRMRAPSFNPFGGFEPDFQNGFIDVAHFVRSPGADTSELALRFPRSATELSVWVDDEWQWFDVDDDTGVLLAIPEEAWSNNTLTARLNGNDFNGNPTAVTLSEVTDATEEVELAPPGEKRERSNRFAEPEFGPGNAGFVQKREPVPVDLVDDSADEMQQEIVLEGVIEGGYDVWEIALVSGDEVEVEMRKFGGELDPFLVVRNPAGTQITEDDDSGGNLNSRLTFSAIEDGVYLVEARPLGGGGAFGEYELIVTITRPPRESADG